MPMIQNTLKATAVVNKGLGMLQCLFHCVPAMPDEAMEEAQTLLAKIKQNNDAGGDYLEDQVQQQAVSNQSSAELKEPEKQEGAALREWKDFMDERDPKNTWADMRRFMLEEEGLCFLLLASLMPLSLFFYF